jgi:hypothetical protein
LQRVSKLCYLGVISLVIQRNQPAKSDFRSSFYQLKLFEAGWTVMGIARRMFGSGLTSLAEAENARLWAAPVNALRAANMM